MTVTEPTPTTFVTTGPTPITSFRSVVLPAPDRGTDLLLRITAPATGGDLPIVVFSHGATESMDAYSPLTEFWATQGFAVLQPTHLDSQTLGLAREDPRTPLIWRSRIEDLTIVLDGLDQIEASVPGLAGRLDRDRIAVAGHSWGATTASALVGARIIDAEGNPGEDMSDPRIRAAVLLAVAGTGGDDLTPFAAEHLSFMNPEFTQMRTAALLVAGDQDSSPLSTRGPDWWTDVYRLSPGQKSLLTLFGSEHTMGGITGFSTHETTDWSFERIEFIQQVTTAYLRSALDIEGESWSQAGAALDGDSHPQGRLDSK